jgi:hypothetical protein
VLTNTQCIVSLSALQSEPFNLLLGVVIQVKVQAINAYGESDLSEIGGLATVQQVPLKPVSLTDLVDVTSDSVIGFSWVDGASDGDSPVLDYRISYDQSTGEYITLVEAQTEQQYTTDFYLLKGQTYSFKVEARNSVGFSEFSDPVSILVAQVPDQVQAPVTTIDGDSVRIDWTIPYDGSSPITKYLVELKAIDGTWAEEIVNCNGQMTHVINDHSCRVLISDLIKAPYHLPWGSSVYARVTATNIKGDSVLGAEGNSAVILTVPDAPTSLQNVPTLLTSDQVGLLWYEGTENGGSEVINYNILYGEATGTYNSEIGGVQTTSYTVSGLTTGTQYKFRV